MSAWNSHTPLPLIRWEKETLTGGGEKAGASGLRQDPPVILLWRVAARSVWLAGEILLALIRFTVLLVMHRGNPDRAARARWLQETCRGALRVFGVHLRITGGIPVCGLLVCNHLSYLDILVCGAITPCIFISKSEVRRWPVFGWLASLAGTLFVCRQKRSDVTRIIHEMRETLDAGVLVVIFPEGTTSDGREVRPFKSSLLEPIAQWQRALSAGFIEYALSDGDVAQEACYWKDMTLVPHLLNLFRKRQIWAQVSFAQIVQRNPDRKALARQLHAQVVSLKEASRKT